MMALALSLRASDAEPAGCRCDIGRRHSNEISPRVARFLCHGLLSSHSLAGGLRAPRPFPFQNHGAASPRSVVLRAAVTSGLRCGGGRSLSLPSVDRQSLNQSRHDGTDRLKADIVAHRRRSLIPTLRTSPPRSFRCVSESLPKPLPVSVNPDTRSIRWTTAVPEGTIR
jgi:hypothetical protein